MAWVESGGPVQVLDLDPSLAQGVPAAEHDQARQRAVARGLDIYATHLRPVDLSATRSGATLGFLVADGLLLRRVTVASRTTGELFGPGDVVRPNDDDLVTYAPLTIAVDWLVLKPARVAVLDEGFLRRVARWPSVVAAVVQRIADRGGRLALRAAVAHLSRADTRLLLMFWLLANRWGTVTTDGVRLELPLTHEVLAMLVGNQRPTITLALHKLAEQGLLIRHSSADWLLTSKAVHTLGHV
ncbi:MAG TPA: helix-turn-helix domain-containing protein [Solirubrobacteraceae bacterium]|jgi:CRP/FNR family transcriptional regulator, cyclic AMP receptor protein|nr:helix-turn-helix domain-containing protein [Solirubrobacteraceae bacterium]